MSKTIIGEGGYGRATVGSEFIYTGVDLDDAGVLLIGVGGSTFKDLSFNANTKAKIALKVTVRNGTNQTTSESILFENCCFSKARNTAASCQVQLGPDPAESVSKDVAFLIFNQCKFYSQFDASKSDLSDGVGCYQGGSSKQFVFKDCNWAGGRNALYFAQSSGNITVTGGFATGTNAYIFNVAQQTTTVNVSGFGCEQVANFANGSAQWSFDSCNMRGWCRTQGALDANLGIMFSLDKATFNNCYFVNYRMERTFTVNTTTNVLSLSAAASPGIYDSLPTDGYAVYLFAESGEDYLTGNGVDIRHNCIYFLRDVTALGSDLYSCKLATIAGGAAIDLTTAGAGVQRIFSPVGMTVGGSVSLTNTYLQWASDHPLLSDTGTNNDSNGLGFKTAARIQVKNCFGGGNAGTCFLRDSSHNYGESLSIISPNLNYYPSIQRIGFAGLALKRKACVMINYNTLKEKNPGSSVFGFYIGIPDRTGISNLIVDVTAFAGSGLTNAVLFATDGTGTGGGLDQSGDILPATSLMATAVFGEREAGEVGIKLRDEIQGGGMINGNYCQPNLATWSIACNLTLTGCTAANLTGGSVGIYFDLDSFPTAAQANPSYLFGGGYGT
jgi:hypothetical protein